MTEPAYTRKESYVLRLHELLWQFIERHDPACERTGVVDEVAEQVLAEIWIATQVDEIDSSMDGDHASALASAGFGTDEDYGG